MHKAEENGVKEEGKHSRERSRSCGSIARKASLKKYFQLRTNFPFFLLLLLLFFATLRAPLCFLCAVQSPGSANFRPSSFHGIREVSSGPSLSLRTSLRLNSSSQETPHGRRRSFFIPVHLLERGSARGYGPVWDATRGS